MKLTIVLLIGFMMTLSATTTYSQKTRLDVNLSKTTIKGLLGYIEQNSEFIFLYRSEDFNTEKIFDIELKDATIKQILDQAFESEKVVYDVYERQIVIRKAINLSVQSQLTKTTKLSGTVYDDEGKPIPGATVLIKGTTKGIVTGIDGAFSIDIESNSVLLVSFIGYETQEIVVGERSTVHIVLKATTEQLEDVTVVAFGKQKKESVVAAITTIKASELKVPSSNLTTSFAGRLSGLIAFQRNGEPGKDDAQYFIRGITTFGNGKANPLILIDGVEMTSYDLSHLSPDDIASFSIMKDANASALYGARGANGVIYVKTKEGYDGITKVALRVESSISTPTSTVELADPVTYMRMYNEAIRTRDPLAQLPYSTEKIMNTQKGIDPMRYPAIDWAKYLFKNTTLNNRYNLSVTGGGKKAQYYISASYSKDNGLLKDDAVNNFSNNVKVKNYQLHSNVTMNLTSTTKAAVRLYTNFNNNTGPDATYTDNAGNTSDGGSAIFNSSREANPVLFLPYYPSDSTTAFVDHIRFGNYGDGKYNNPYAQMVKGYKESEASNVSAQLELNQDLEFVTKGLSIRGLINIIRNSAFSLSRSYSPFYYALSNSITDDYRLQSLNTDGSEFLNKYTEGNKTVSAATYFEAAAQYKTSLLEKHEISGLLVSTLRNSLNGNAGSLINSLPSRNIGLAGRFTYGYDNRYFFEANFGYNGSERFDKRHRMGFFPSVGAGWVISNESFMKPLENTISMLKLKATYGLVGNDQIGNTGDRFFYLSNVTLNQTGGYAFGTLMDKTFGTVSIGRYADPLITWEISKKANYGIEIGLYKDLNLQLDYYTERRTNILQDRAYIPTTMGLQTTPSANVGKAKGKGYDLSVTYNHAYNSNLWITAMGNFTYATAKYTSYEEPDYKDAPWRSHNAQMLSQNWGLIAERIFVDDNEVSNSPKQSFGVYGAGDIKYKDINYDGIIDDQDKVPIGYPSLPKITYGAGFSLGYKGLDFSCFFQGSALSSFFLDPRTTNPFQSTINPRAMLKSYADNHWSEENRNLFALWPRLSEVALLNNTQTSTWWLRDGTFLRMKNLEVGYTLPSRLVKRLFMSKVRLYLSGTNLFVLTPFKMWDPEMAGNGLQYPLQRVYNVGVNINF